MTCTVSIVLKGPPERVQEIADTMDKAMPNAFEWHDFASRCGEVDIVLTGTGSRAFTRR